MDSPNTPSDTNNNASFEVLVEQLKARPDLIPLVERMLDLSNDSLPDKPSAHQVEDQAFKLMRELGSKVLSDWSQSAHDHAKEEAGRLRDDLVVHRKKKSSGTAGSEPSD